MSVAYGKVEYQIDSSQVVAFGVSHTSDEMISTLTNEVHDKVYDITGNSDLIDSILTGLSDTGFTKDVLTHTFENNDNINDWEIGEAYAQVYIEKNLSSVMPWSLSRDIKKPGSSLPGADIVGLYQDDDSVCFLFGEIKTSSDQNSPPGLMYGQTGLKRQLEDLCSNYKITLALVKYLGFRLKDTKYWSYYQKAFCKYQANNSDVHIIGMLVRDVCPNEKDLSSRAASLCPFCVEGRDIKLVAIYLPIDSIPNFISIAEQIIVLFAAPMLDIFFEYFSEGSG